MAGEPQFSMSLGEVFALCVVLTVWTVIAAFLITQVVSVARGDSPALSARVFLGLFLFQNVVGWVLFFLSPPENQGRWNRAGLAVNAVLVVLVTAVHRRVAADTHTAWRGRAALLIALPVLLLSLPALSDDFRRQVIFQPLPFSWEFGFWGGWWLAVTLGLSAYASWTGKLALVCAAFAVPAFFLLETSFQVTSAFLDPFSLFCILLLAAIGALIREHCAQTPKRRE